MGKTTALSLVSIVVSGQLASHFFSTRVCLPILSTKLPQKNRDRRVPKTHLGFEGMMRRRGPKGTVFKVAGG